MVTTQNFLCAREIFSICFLWAYVRQCVLCLHNVFRVFFFSDVSLRKVRNVVFALLQLNLEVHLCLFYDNAENRCASLESFS